jgi:hypothetical protein
MKGRTRQWFGRVVLGVVVLMGVPGGARAQKTANETVANAAAIQDESMRLREAGDYDKAIVLAQRALSMRQNI